MVLQNSVWNSLHNILAPNRNILRPNSDQSYNLYKKIGKKINHNCSSGLVERSFSKPAKLLSLKSNFFRSNSKILYTFSQFSWKHFSQNVPLDTKKALSKPLSKTSYIKSDHIWRKTEKLFISHLIQKISFKMFVWKSVLRLSGFVRY